jgi:outer membrane protein assembly factor BamA
MFVRIFIMFLTLLYAHTSLSYSIDVSLRQGGYKSYELIKLYMPESLWVSDIEIISDCQADKDELLYIMDIYPRSYITHNDLIKAMSMLSKKESFDSVCIRHESQAQGVKLFLDIKGLWRLDNIYIKGDFLKKDTYKHVYTIDYGEPFSLEKHQQSLKMLKQKLYDAGYVSAHITDTFEYHKNRKTVSVTCLCEQMYKIAIDDVHVDVSTHDNTVKDKLTRKIYKHWSTLKGSEFSKSSLEHCEKDIKAYLLGKGYLAPRVNVFEKIICKDGKNVLDVAISIDVPYKKRFTFLGNNFFSDYTLRKELLLVGDSALFIPPDIFADDIVDLYKDKGFFNVHVEYKEDKDLIVFIIKEGTRAYINHIDFEIRRSHAYDEYTMKALKDYIRYNFIYYSAHSYYDTSQLNRMYDNIYSYLIHKGFKSAQCVNKSVTCVDKHNQQYTIHVIYDVGYIVDQSHHESPRDDVDDVTSKPVFGKIIYKGNSTLPLSTLLKESECRCGEPFSQEALQITASRLKALDIFESVSLYCSPESADSDIKDIILHVVESDRRQVRARIGVQKTDKVFTGLGGTTYKVGGSFLYKNPFNKADVLRADIDVTRYGRNIMAQYQVPHMGSYRIMSIMSVYNKLFEQPFFIGSPTYLYTVSKNGGLYSLSSSYDYVKAFIGMSLESIKLKTSESDLADVITYSKDLIDTPLAYASVEPYVVYSHSDNTYNPTYAVTSSLSLKGALSLKHARSSFVKVIYEHTYVRPLGYSLIGAIRGQCGHIFSYGLDRVIPSERFFLGGPY